MFALGINHNTAPIEVREQLYVSEHEVPGLISRLRESLSECVVVSTCNRTEIYGVTEGAVSDLDRFKDVLIDFKNARGRVSSEHFFEFVSCAACRQIFSVATSVDSKIVGDAQILGQLRKAYSLATEQNASGKVLNQLLQRAFKVGKRTYNDTSIHKGAISVSLSAVELAAKTLGSLENRSVLVIGAGDTARMTAECLIRKQVGNITITNRSRGSAESLLDDLRKQYSFEGRIAEFAGFKRLLNEIDIVISSTGSEGYVLGQSDFRLQERRIFLIDIAVPRDIAPEVESNRYVVLKNIDDLSSHADRNYERRMRDLPRINRIIAKEMGDFLMWYYTIPLMPEMEKTGTKPGRATAEEMLRIKSFLRRNVSHLHKLAMNDGSDLKQDLKSHFELVELLKEMKAGYFEGVNA